MLRVLPYAALAISTILVLIAGPRSWERTGITIALVAAAAMWLLTMVTLRPDPMTRPRGAAVYYVGLQVLFAVLLWHSPLFGFFVWTGYIQVPFLRGHWRWAGVTATAAFLSTTYVGGYDHLTLGILPLYLIFTAASTALGGAFMFFGTMVSDQNTRQRTMLAELAEANAQLETALAENAGLQAQLLAQAREAGVHDERQRMAREIHDTLAQGFTGIIAQLEAAKQNPGQWLRFADQAQALARDNLSEARRSVRAVQPEDLEDAHLPEAIAGMSERWSEASGVPVGVETTGDPRPMLADVEVALFRVAQEALTNVAKHAKASRVGLTLSYLEDVVLLDVRDDGVGFVPGDGSGFGLTSMRQRVMRVAGSLAVESTPGEGTAVNATVPALPAGDRT